MSFKLKFGICKANFFKIKIIIFMNILFILHINSYKYIKAKRRKQTMRVYQTTGNLQLPF